MNPNPPPLEDDPNNNNNGNNDNGDRHNNINVNADAVMNMEEEDAPAIVHHGGAEEQGEDEEDTPNVLPELLRDHPAVLAFQSTNSSFIVTNPRLPGNPIVYASPGFLQLTGYQMDRVLGRNCRFLQGPETDPSAVATMREAIENEHDIHVTLLNYRRDGSTFWNRILISGVRDVQPPHPVQYFLGVQHLMSAPVAGAAAAAPVATAADGIGMNIEVEGVTGIDSNQSTQFIG